MKSSLHIFSLTLIALIAFAANSVLARLGLTLGDIGPWSFSLIRILSGAFILALLVMRQKTDAPRNVWQNGSWRGAATLLIYASFFSYAYLTLPTGTGALILFAMVQITMLGAAFIYGERLTAVQIFGSILAMGGLIYLLTPSIEAPSPVGALMMAIAGIGWGLYSLLGRNKAHKNPTAQTAGNFLRAAVIALLVSPFLLFLFSENLPAAKGIGFAILSGALTSGLGYAIWYAALKSLPASRAAIAQLSVPPLAALGGILFLDEAITPRFILATLIIFAGIILATLLPQKVTR